MITLVVLALGCKSTDPGEVAVPLTAVDWRKNEEVTAAVAKLGAGAGPATAWLDGQAALEKEGKPTDLVPGMKVSDIPAKAQAASNAAAAAEQAKAEAEARAKEEAVRTADAALAAEVCQNVEAIKVAEAGYEAVNDSYYAASPWPRAVTALTAESVPWPAGSDFDMLGWAPDSRTAYGTYWVDLSGAGTFSDGVFVAHGAAKNSKGEIIHCEATKDQSARPTPL